MNGLQTVLPSGERFRPLSVPLRPAYHILFFSSDGYVFSLSRKKSALHFTKGIYIRKIAYSAVKKTLQNACLYGIILIGMLSVA